MHGVKSPCNTLFRREYNVHEWLRKNVYWTIASIFLILLTLFVFSKVEITETLHFRLCSNDYTAELSIYESEEGCLYVFLPSYAQMDHLELVVPKGMDAALGDIPLTDGMNCESFALEMPYAYRVDGRYVADLFFYRSANVATMFVETATGSMEKIHEDKNYSEPAHIRVVTADGEVECYDRNALLEGRGNATWTWEKRPYLMKLSSEKGLFGMNSAKKWVLLANAYDETNLNNKIVLDLAKHTGLEWSPDCVYIDLYLNGGYNGLYLLVEKVETGASRLDIDVQNGDFLCKIDLAERWSTLINPVMTNAGRTVEISEPMAINEERKEKVLGYINQMEEILLSDADLNTIASFDLDSWVRRYLIDEISGNIDSDLASSYFYYSNGVFYAGPIWDYDIAFGNSERNQNPISFIAKNKYKADSFITPYYASLYANESFYKRMIEVYKTEFLPLLNQMLETELPRLEAEIQAASNINSIRWRTLCDSLQAGNRDSVCTPDDLEAYLERRIAFLSDAWLNDTEYCTVQFEWADGSCYWNISVRKGDKLETTYMDIENTPWINNSTGAKFDFSKPILTDMILTRQIEVVETVPEIKEAEVLPLDIPVEEPTFSWTTKDYVLLLSVALLVLLFFGLVCVDIVRFRGKRSNAHGF